MADVTDKDRLAAYTLDALIGTVFNSPSSPQIVEWCEQAIARARADADEAGYSRGLREGAASERDRLEVWADFGSWAFESFWDEGEPGDLDWCDLQEEAINLGLLTRRGEKHAAYNCADGCEWLPGRPFGECACLFPNKPPLAAIRARGERFPLSGADAPSEGGKA